MSNATVSGAAWMELEAVRITIGDVEVDAFVDLSAEVTAGRSAVTAGDVTKRDTVPSPPPDGCDDPALRGVVMMQLEAARNAARRKPLPCAICTALYPDASSKMLSDWGCTTLQGNGACRHHDDGCECLGKDPGCPYCADTEEVSPCLHCGDPSTGSDLSGLPACARHVREESGPGCVRATAPREDERTAS